MVLVYVSLWLTLLFVAAAFYFFLTRETTRYRRAIDRRLNEIAYAGHGGVPPEMPLSQRVLARLEIGAQLQRILRQADVRQVINRFVLVSLAVGLAGGTLALLVSGSGVAALAVTLGGMSAPLFAVVLAVLVR